MNLFQNRRLVKAAAILSMILFLLVFSSIFITYLVFNDQLKRQLADTNMELLRQLDNKLELTLKNLDKSAIQLMKHDEVIRFFDHELDEQESRNNSFRVSNLITNIVNSTEQIFSMDLYSYSKQRLVSGNTLTEQDMLQDFSWINQFAEFEGLSHWMPTHKVKMTLTNYPIYRNVVTLVRTYPLLHTPGSRKGAIAVNLKEDVLYNLIRNTDRMEEGQTFVIDGEGVVILHADKSKLGKDISEFPYISRLLQGQQDGYFQSEVEHINSSVFYVHEAYTDWKIVRIVPEDQLTRPLTVVRNGLIILALVLFVVATGTTAIVGRWTYKPVNRFIRTMSNRLAVHPRQNNADEFQYFESTVEHILQDREQLHMQVNESKPLLKWRLLSELLSNQRSSLQAVEHYMDRIGIRLHPNRFVVMSVDFDNKQDIASPRDLQLYAYALCNVAEELMNAENRGIAAEMDTGKCAVIMSFDDSDEAEAERHLMRAVAVADLMKNFVQEYFNRTITIGIGDVVEQVGAIRYSYKQSLEALRYKLVIGGNTIITQEDIASGQSPQFHRLLVMTDGMIASIKVLDAEKLRQQVRRWFEAFAEHSVPPEMIVQLIVQFLMKASTVAAEIGVETEELFPEQYRIELLNQYERLEHLEQYTVNALDIFIERIKEKRSSREKNDVIDQVLLYIQTHYMRSDLSLNLLASEFRISVSHLSKLFKEQKECNFIDFLMEIRMNKAKELLAESEEKIRDIAEQVGYTNVNSFVRIFKKITGLTPTEFRSRAQSEDA
ncbi:helix-turn-helix domain-containing protein [Paenibacillus sp. GCM10027626]|uniref:helix-turn-helix domain-containing protein n=1 Tax=Paenibacillus sp. GCM10027626 TaxID=3273411 RepID=UPI00362F6806